MPLGEIDKTGRLDEATSRRNGPPASDRGMPGGFELEVNARRVCVTVDRDTPLLYVLRAPSRRESACVRPPRSKRSL